MSLTLTNVMTITRTLTLSLNLSVAISIYLSLSVSIYRLMVNPQRSQLTHPLYIGNAKWLTGGLVCQHGSTNNGPSQRWHQGPRRLFVHQKQKWQTFVINNNIDYNKSRDMVQNGWKCISDFSSTLFSIILWDPPSVNSQWPNIA